MPPIDPRTLARWTSRLAVRNDRAASRAAASLARQRARGLRILLSLAESCERPVVLRWVMDALGTFRTPAATAALRAGLRSPHMTVRLHALAAVDRLGDPALLRALRPLASDSSGGIRVNALATLARHRVPGLKAVLRKALRDPKDYVRRVAGKGIEALEADAAARRG